MFEANSFEISKFGGKEETLFNYCGFGDFSLTALNDLSRNRTLGLLIGKGFFTSDELFPITQINMFTLTTLFII